MEKDKKVPSLMSPVELEKQLTMIGAVIEKLTDPDIFTWLGKKGPVAKSDVERAATIVADRLSGANANPTIRNAQERRQLAAIREWLEKRGYTLAEGVRFNAMLPGTFSFRMNVPIKLEGGTKTINIPIDAAIKPKKSKADELPLFFEAKSAGDFTNTNKRRKEEAVKMSQLRSNYGAAVRFNLFLCGYFDSGYLGYEASEAIDWVWEHRIDDLAQFGL
jgi:type II restriction enzyme